MTHHPAEASASPINSMLRSIASASTSRPPRRRGMAMRNRPAAAMAPARSAGKRRASSISPAARGTNGLVRADRFSELPALLRVAPRVVDRRRGDTVRDCGNLQLLDIERRAGEHPPALVPGGGAAEDAFGRHRHLLEDDIGGGGIA